MLFWRARGTKDLKIGSEHILQDFILNTYCIIIKLDFRELE